MGKGKKTSEDPIALRRRAMRFRELGMKTAANLVEKQASEIEAIQRGEK